MKSYIRIFIAFSAAVLSFDACNRVEPEPDGPVTPVVPEIIPSEINITETEITITSSGTYTLVCETKEGTDNPDGIKWESDDETVATVDEDGTVTGAGYGSTWIFAAFGEAKDSCKVTISAMEIAQVDNLIKILPGEEVRNRYDTLRVARGETATLQLAITALEDIGTVTPSVSFRDGVLPASMGWLRNVKCSAYWPSWAGSVPPDALTPENDMFPDPIMPADKWEVSLKKGERAVLWTEFSIDRTMPAGMYEGELRLKISNNHTFSAPFAIQVYPAVLPEKQSFTLVQWETGTYDAMNGGNSVEVGSDRYFELQSNVVQLVSEYGQNSFRLHDGIIPSKISSWYNRNADGSLVLDPATGKPEFFFDFWSIDKYIENYLKNCPDVHQIHAPGFVSLSGNRLKAAVMYYNGTDSWPSGKGALPEDEDAEYFIKSYFSKLEAHLKSRKLDDGRTWFDIYHQSIFDEPTDARAADWNAWARLVKAGSPTMKIVEATNTDKLDPALCDILCPVLSNLSYTTAKAGQTQWFYTAVIPAGTYANRFVSLPLIKTRLLHWIHYKYNSTGTLHWGLMYWMGVSDPYAEIQGSGLPGGDLFIIYPGDGVAYPSIRLAAMRDGIHDYELLKLAASISETDAKAIADKIIYDYSSYNTDVNSFRRTRQELLQLLSGTKK